MSDDLTYFESSDPTTPRCVLCYHRWADHRKLGEGLGSYRNWQGCIEIVFLDEGDTENCWCEEPPPEIEASPLALSAGTPMIYPTAAINARPPAGYPLTAKGDAK
jgi:hypothetical protein